MQDFLKLKGSKKKIKEEEEEEESKDKDSHTDDVLKMLNDM